MRKLAISMVAVAAVLSAQSVSAQTEVVAEASITIPTLLQIGVTNTTVAFPTPDFTDYDAGVVGMSSAASVVSTRGNVVHDVLIQAASANMTLDGLASLKPASHLQWSLGGVFTGLSTTAATLASALAKGNNATAATVSYQMVLDEANDAPGVYSLGFTYTVVAN